MERGARVRLTGPRTGALVLATAALVAVTSGTAFVAITAALDGVTETPRLHPLPSPASPAGRAPVVALPVTTDEPRPDSRQPTATSGSLGARRSATQPSPTAAPAVKPVAPAGRGNGNPAKGGPTRPAPAQPDTQRPDTQQPDTQQPDDRPTDDAAERERDRERDRHRDDDRDRDDDDRENERDDEDDDERDDD